MSGVTPAMAAAAAPATPANDQGYLYHLVREIGASDFVARTVQAFVVKPIEVVLVLVLAVAAARLGSRAARRYLRTAEARAARRPGRRRTSPQRLTTVTALVTSVWKVAVWVVAVLIVLETIGVDLTPLLAGATVLGAAIGFGAQNLIRDFLAGVFIVTEDQYGIGDAITVGETTGVVEEVSLRITRLRSEDGTVWYLRNGDIGRVGNCSMEWSRAQVDVVIPAGADLERAMSSMSQELVSFGSDERWVDACLEDPEMLGVEGQAAEGLTLSAAVRTRAGQGGAVERALRGRIVSRLSQEGILAPAD
jgi:small-conductance mechanosensitive channel